MKNFIFVMAIVSIVCFSCDGRKTKKEALEHAVLRFNAITPVLDIATYQPEAYSEMITDTIIDNSVKVSIKNYTLLDEQILVSETANSKVNTMKYQRVFESEITINRLEKTILSTHISAKHFKTNVPSDPFWDNATLQHAWVNQELSTSDIIKLHISFINPKSKNYKLYSMSIDKDGQQTIDLVEQSS